MKADDSHYFVHNGRLLDIGAGDVIAIIDELPETPPEAWAAGWNAARRHIEAQQNPPADS